MIAALKRQGTIEILLIKVDYCKTIYSATLVDGEWPSEADLIDLADGESPMAAYFGGHVELTTDAKVKLVTVFTD